MHDGFLKAQQPIKVDIIILVFTQEETGVQRGQVTGRDRTGTEFNLTDSRTHALKATPCHLDTDGLRAHWMASQLTLRLVRPLLCAVHPFLENPSRMFGH